MKYQETWYFLVEWINVYLRANWRWDVSSHWWSECIQVDKIEVYNLAMNRIPSISPCLFSTNQHIINLLVVCKSYKSFFSLMKDSTTHIPMKSCPPRQCQPLSNEELKIIIISWQVWLSKLYIGVIPIKIG